MRELFSVYSVFVFVLGGFYMEKHAKEGFLYVCSGAVTTLVNYSVYWLLLAWHTPYLIANCLSWVAAVLVAYLLNRTFVFASSLPFWPQLLQFASLRLVTLGSETLLLFCAVDCLHLSQFISKVCISVITVAANYGLCKYKIFTQKRS